MTKINLLLKATKVKGAGYRRAGAKWIKKIPWKKAYKYFYTKQEIEDFKQKQTAAKEKKGKGWVVEPKPSPILSGAKQFKTSPHRKFYYQVEQPGGGWKKYTTHLSYKKDYPNGPEKGHQLVNQDHDAHLRIARGTHYAKVGDKTYMSRAELLADHPIDKGEAKDHRKAEGDVKGADVTIKEPNFFHIDWHPKVEDKLNTDQRVFLGVENEYQKHRARMDIIYDRERHARAGKEWNAEIYRKNKAEGKTSMSYVPKNIEGLKTFEPKKRTSAQREGGVIRKGTPVFFKKGGKEYQGKVVEAHSIGKGGQAIQKAATHFDIEWTKGGRVGDFGKKKTQIIRISAANVKRKTRARTVKSQVIQDVETEATNERRIERTLSRAQDRLVKEGGGETDASKIIAKEMGDLTDKNNKYRGIIAKNIRKVKAEMENSGMKIYADLTHEQLIMAGMAGVYEAGMEAWNPDKAKLTTFLLSDKVKPYVYQAIKDAVAVERGQIHRMGSEMRRDIMAVKQVRMELKQALDREPSVDEIKDSFIKRFGPSKGNLSKLIEQSKRRQVSNILRGEINAEGEIDITDKTASPIKGPVKAYEEKETMSEIENTLSRLVDPIQAHILKERFRFDESKTGKGVFGQESPYYKGGGKAESQAGQEKLGKEPSLKNFSEIAKDLTDRGLKINKDQVQEKIDQAIETIQKKFQAGDAHAKKFQSLYMELNKSYKAVLNEMRLVLLKSGNKPKPEQLWTAIKIKRQITFLKAMMPPI